MSDGALARSIRTLAWLGDAVFEQDVRRRLVQRGDYPTDRLDAMKAEIVRAEAQSKLLAAIEPTLDEIEHAVARRARNARVGGTARTRTRVQEYRRATALEALVAHWELQGEAGQQRYLDLVVPHLEAAIDQAIERRRQRPRRG